MTVADKLAKFGMHKIDLSDGAVLERGCVYIVKLLERLRLPVGISAMANPKSSTGRLDIFTRLITDGAREFLSVADGIKRAFIAIGNRFKFTRAIGNQAGKNIEPAG